MPVKKPLERRRYSHLNTRYDSFSSTRTYGASILNINVMINYDESLVYTTEHLIHATSIKFENGRCSFDIRCFFLITYNKTFLFSNIILIYFSLY